jgi:2-polyprenyl-3-methyl-5-hydroxy-6-metoxy-1,4-benzoquinol methylase
MALLSGERQVAPSLSGIRGDHIARYRFAVEHLTNHRAVLDAGCGIGYGAKLLAESGHDVHAWDVDPDAIHYGRDHYDHVKIRWSVADICAGKSYQPTAVVAFEILEHLERPGLALIRFPDYLIASVPNGAVVLKMPGTYPHHVRHYTPAEFWCLLTGAGYEVQEWWSQEGTTDRPLIRGNEGRTLVARCVR